MALRSSRTLPGQACARMRATASRAEARPRPARARGRTPRGSAARAPRRPAALAQRRQVDADHVAGGSRGPRGSCPRARAARGRGWWPRRCARRSAAGACRRRGGTRRPASTRSSFACVAGVMSPISSRNSVPPSACSKRPARWRSAPVKAPRSWPNSSRLEQRLGQRRAVHLHERARRRAASRRGSGPATSSLPVPVSPVSSTVERLGATRVARARPPPASPRSRRRSAAREARGALRAQRLDLARRGARARPRARRAARAARARRASARSRRRRASSPRRRSRWSRRPSSAPRRCARRGRGPPAAPRGRRRPGRRRSVTTTS